jgi:GNAT superfamily N-acetyltransferase
MNLYSSVSKLRFAILIASAALAGCISTAPLRSEYGQSNPVPSAQAAQQTTATTRTVRLATIDDLDAIESLCQKKFHQYEKYQLLYYKIAPDARERHVTYLSDQIHLGQQIMLVHQTHDKIDGFIMAKVLVPVPVYDQSLVTCLVDDFVVDDPAHWPSIGTKLLNETERLSHQRGAIQTFAVCGHLDEAKRRFLHSRG